MLRNGHSMIGFLAKGAKNWFQYCLNPQSSRHFLNLKAIQGQSEGIAIDPELQDSVLLPKGFTECMYHVRNVSEVESIIKKLVDSGRTKSQTGKEMRVLHDSESDGFLFYTKILGNFTRIQCNGAI